MLVKIISYCSNAISIKHSNTHSKFETTTSEEKLVMQISLWSELKKPLGAAKISFDLRLALKGHLNYRLIHFQV